MQNPFFSSILFSSLPPMSIMIHDGYRYNTLEVCIIPLIIDYWSWHVVNLASSDWGSMGSYTPERGEKDAVFRWGWTWRHTI